MRACMCACVSVCVRVCVCVRACMCVQEAEHLITRKLHPQTVIAGYRKAVDQARQALTDAARDNGTDQDKFKEVGMVGVA